MAYILPGERAEKMQDVTIYCIVSPFAKKFHIGKSGPHRLRKVYAEHYSGRVEKTKILFQRAKDSGCLPPMYVLESGYMSSRMAFRACVAWAKYFIDQGYEQVTEDILTEYAGDLVEAVQKVYAGIKDKSLSEVLQPAGGLFPDYNTRKKNVNGRMQVCFPLDPEDYDRLKKAAEAEGLSLSAYCRQMALHGKIIQLDASAWFHFLEEYRETKQLLRQILFTIYQTGKYLPVDLAIIQKSVDHLTELSKKGSEEFLDLMTAISHGGD